MGMCDWKLLQEFNALASSGFRGSGKGGMEGEKKRMDRRTQLYQRGRWERGHAWANRDPIRHSIS